MRARRQAGVAVVTALLLTTLAVTIVTSLFWQQQVQIRSMENQRLQLQTKWALRAALDWSRQVLRDDAMSSQVDHLGEGWAQPMSKIELDEYVENGREGGAASNATLSGRIVDAQARFNLTNLAENGQIDPEALDQFRRLLAIVRLDPALAMATAQRIAQTQIAPGAPGSGDAAHEQAALSHTADLLTIPGFTPDGVQRLSEFIALIPQKTFVNVNTAPAEVLAALFNKSPMEMNSVVHARAQAYFLEENNFTSRMQITSPTARVTTQSTYFLVYGTVHMDRASVDMEALIYRKNTGNTTLRWLRSF
ncbi:MAG: type II secretion system minor pseudopilin GspK [Pseudomonadota bacterium]